MVTPSQLFSDILQDEVDLLRGELDVERETHAGLLANLSRCDEARNLLEANLARSLESQILLSEEREGLRADLSYVTSELDSLKDEVAKLNDTIARLRAHSSSQYWYSVFLLAVLVVLAFALGMFTQTFPEN